MVIKLIASGKRFNQSCLHNETFMRISTPQGLESSWGGEHVKVLGRWEGPERARKLPAHIVPYPMHPLQLAVPEL